MKEQKERAREARKALGDLGWAGVEFGKDVPATEFVGYDHSECDAKIVAIVADEELRDEVAAGAEAVVVLDQSPFYAEMGGQVADHGTITADGVVFTVADVQKNKGGKFMHYGRLAQGVLHVGDTVHAAIDMERRKAIQPCSQHHPPAGYGAEKGAGRPRPSGGLSGGAGPPALRLHPL